MRLLKRRILKLNGLFRRHMTPIYVEKALAVVTDKFATPMVRSSLPKKKQRELGLRPSVAHEMWQEKQERNRLKKIKALSNMEYSNMTFK